MFLSNHCSLTNLFFCWFELYDDLFSSVDQIIIIAVCVNTWLLNVCEKGGVLMAVSCGKMADQG